MSESKRQSIIMTAVGLVLLSAVILYFALSQPKVLVSGESETASSQSTVSQHIITGSQVYNITGDAYVASTIINNNEYYEADTKENAQSEISYPIDLNSCTAEDLTSINGIGDVKAQSIIEYREYLGGYTSVEQIKNISGIGESTYEKIAPYLTV